MKIMIAGIMPSSIKSIYKRLTDIGYHVDLVSDSNNKKKLSPLGIRVIDKNSSKVDLSRLIKAARYQAVIFFCTLQEDIPKKQSAFESNWLDDLLVIKNNASTIGLGQLILITDYRVFGSTQLACEDEEPVPDSIPGILLKTAEAILCQDKNRKVLKLIIRTTRLYAPGSHNGFFSEVIESYNNGFKYRLNGSPDDLCDFFHADDLAVYLSYALNEKHTGIVHLAYGKLRTYSDVMNVMKNHLPELKVEYSEATNICSVLKTGTSQKVDWIPRHDCLEEMASIIELGKNEKRDSRILRIWHRFRKKNRGMLPWVELVCFGCIAWRISSSMIANANFDFISPWAIYAGIMGLAHGSGFGTLAAGIALLAYVLKWTMNSNDIYSLFFNTDNWLEPLFYFLTGTVLGHIRDAWKSHEQDLEENVLNHNFEMKQIRLLYDQVTDDRNRLVEQVKHNQDSFGRIYRITRELDNMQPAHVLSSTLGIVEDIMENQSTAIYARKDNQPYARLMLQSREIGRLERSLNLEMYPDLLDSINQGKLYINTSLLEGYPAMVAPVNDGSTPIALIILWKVSFEKFGLYYENLLNIVSGLVQMAMVRASKYFNHTGGMYVEETRILTEEPFMAAYNVYQAANQSGTGKLILLKLSSSVEMTPQEFDRRIGRVIRYTDIAGRLNSNVYYVMLLQAENEDIPAITLRLYHQGFQCEHALLEASYA